MYYPTLPFLADLNLTIFLFKRFFVQKYLPFKEIISSGQFLPKLENFLY
jgi:hypothetical protein